MFDRDVAILSSKIIL